METGKKSPKKNAEEYQEDSSQASAKDRLIWENIEYILGQKGWSQSDLARAAGKPRQLISNIKHGKGVGPKILAEFAAALDVTQEDLLTPRAWREQGPLKELGEFSLVPKYPTRLSAGPGRLSDTQQVEANFAFRTDWLSGKSGNVALFQVSGDSMTPEIRDGDVVLVNLDDKDPARINSGKIYALLEGEYTKVKILRLQDKDLWVHSSHDSHEQPYRVSTQEGHFQIIGRVIWVGHEVR